MMTTPPDIDETKHLLNDFIQAFRKLIEAGDEDAAKWLAEGNPQLFAAATQGFVNFGSLVGAAFPEMLAVLQTDEAAPKDEEADLVVSELSRALADEAKQHAGKIAELTQNLESYIANLDQPSAALTGLLQSAQAVEACWDQIASEAETLPAAAAAQPDAVAVMRAVPAVWERIAGLAVSAQTTLDEVVAPPAGAALRVVKGGKEEA